MGNLTVSGTLEDVTNAVKEKARVHYRELFPEPDDNDGDDAHREWDDELTRVPAHIGLEKRVS